MPKLTHDPLDAEAHELEPAAGPEGEWHADTDPAGTPVGPERRLLECTGCEFTLWEPKG